MSISSAPAATASRMSASFTDIAAPPGREAVATLATFTPEPASASRATGDHVGVDADGGHRWAARVAGVGTAALGAERAHLAGRVLPSRVVRSIIRDRDVDGPALGVGLDRPGGQRGGSRVGADLVDAGQPVQERA